MACLRKGKSKTGVGGACLVHPRHSPGHFNMFSHLIFMTDPLGVGTVIPSCRPGKGSLRWHDEGSTARKSQSWDSHTGLSGCQALAPAALWVLKGVHTCYLR